MHSVRDNKLIRMYGTKNIEFLAGLRARKCISTCQGNYE